MIETRQCLSGHLVPIYEFGVDRSKPDSLNLYCKNCIRNHRNNETVERNAQGLNARGVPLQLNESERAIERERHKRRVEKEIELELQPEPVKPEFEQPSSPIFTLGEKFWRKGTGRTVGWSCPVGTCST